MIVFTLISPLPLAGLLQHLRCRLYLWLLAQLAHFPSSYNGSFRLLDVLIPAYADWAAHLEVKAGQLLMQKVERFAVILEAFPDLDLDQ
jgi:hypothetical protein